MNILFRLRDCQVDLNIHSVHMSEDTLSDDADNILHSEAHVNDGIII